MRQHSPQSQIAPATTMRGRRIGGAAVGWLALATLACLVLAAAPVRAQGMHGALPEDDTQIFSYGLLQVDATSASGTGVMSLAGEGWIGTDLDRLWWNVEGDLVGGSVSDMQLRAMYGHYVARFWDAVVGYRRDIRPVGVNYLGAGIRGLAPYWFDVDAMLFVSDRAKLSVQTEVSTDWLLMQRLILRPELRLDWPLMRDPVRDLDPGLGDADIGIATRYEIRRKFAPYIDVRWTRRAGYATALGEGEGHDVTGWTVRGGLWLIF